MTTPPTLFLTMDDMNVHPDPSSPAPPPPPSPASSSHIMVQPSNFRASQKSSPISDEKYNNNNKSNGKTKPTNEKRNGRTTPTRSASPSSPPSPLVISSLARQQSSFLLCVPDVLFVSIMNHLNGNDMTRLSLCNRWLQLTILSSLCHDNWRNAANHSIVISNDQRSYSKVRQSSHPGRDFSQISQSDYLIKLAERAAAYHKLMLQQRLRRIHTVWTFSGTCLTPVLAPLMILLVFVFIAFELSTGMALIPLWVLSLLGFGLLSYISVIRCTSRRLHDRFVQGNHLHCVFRLLECCC
jgi:hypothetical protein